MPRRRLPRYLPSLYTRLLGGVIRGTPDEWGRLCPGQLGRALPYPAEEEIADPDEGLEEIIVDEVPPEFRESPPGVPPATAAVPAQEEERDENEDGLTEQDRADLAVLRETYDRIARRWQALSPRARNKRLLDLARGGTIPLAGLVHISAATQAEPAENPTTPAAAKGRGKRPRYLPGDLRPSAVTARSDPKYQQDLDAGLTSQDAFKRHKSRFRALLHAMKSGKDIPNTPARQGRTTGELPPLQS